MAKKKNPTGVTWYEPNYVLAAILTGAHGKLRPLLEAKTTKVANLYRQGAARSEGKTAKDRRGGVPLADSATWSVDLEYVIKGQPRLVGTVKIGGTRSLDTWVSKEGLNPNPDNEFYYGALQELSLIHI